MSIRELRRRSESNIRRATCRSLRASIGRPDRLGVAGGSRDEVLFGVPDLLGRGTRRSSLGSLDDHLDLIQARLSPGEGRACGVVLLLKTLCDPQPTAKHFTSVSCELGRPGVRAGVRRGLSNSPRIGFDHQRHAQCLSLGLDLGQQQDRVAEFAGPQRSGRDPRARPKRSLGSVNRIDHGRRMKVLNAHRRPKHQAPTDLRSPGSTLTSTRRDRTCQHTHRTISAAVRLTIPVTTELKATACRPFGTKTASATRAGTVEMTAAKRAVQPSCGTAVVAERGVAGEPNDQGEAGTTTRPTKPEMDCAQVNPRSPACDECSHSTWRVPHRRECVKESQATWVAAPISAAGKTRDHSLAPIEQSSEVARARRREVRRPSGSRSWPNHAAQHQHTQGGTTISTPTQEWVTS